MKKQAKRIIAFFCVCILGFCNIGTAFADAGINNVIIGSNPNSVPMTSADTAHQNGLNMIRATGDAGNITLPNPENYLETPDTMYVNSPAKHSINSYLTPWKDKSKLGEYPFHGTKVQVIAEKDGFSCIIFHDEKNRAHTSWVYSSELSWYFPGIEQTLGTPCVQYGSNLGDLPVRWSQERFVHSGQKYTIFDEKVANCVQFTLDYQVIARNGAKTEEVLGPRTVYVNDGSGWVDVGAFSFSDFDAYHIIVNLDKPMDLAAIATIASCGQPDTFKFRQSVLDIMTTAE